MKEPPTRPTSRCIAHNRDYARFGATDGGIIPSICIKDHILGGDSMKHMRITGSINEVIEVIERLLDTHGGTVSVLEVIEQLDNATVVA